MLGGVAAAVGRAAAQSAEAQPPPPQSEEKKVNVKAIKVPLQPEPKPVEAEKSEPVEDAAAADAPESDFDEDSAENSLDGIAVFAANLLRLYRESDSARAKLNSLAKDLLATNCWLYETLQDIDPK